MVMIEEIQQKVRSLNDNYKTDKNAAKIGPLLYSRLSYHSTIVQIMFILQF